MKTKTIKLDAVRTHKKSVIEKAQDFLMENYQLRLNEITGTVEGKKTLSLAPYEEINENDLFIDLHLNGIKISMASLISILNSSFLFKHDPFKSYFLGKDKVWSHEKHGDLIEKLALYVKCEDQERFNKHFRKMLVRSVACSILPYVFNKQAFIFVQSEQNSGKSSFCRWLCPPALKDYFSENIGLDKDSLIALCENFIINLDELASLSKADLNGLKSVFSLASVKARPPYGRKAVKMTRRANFVGSTNRLEFLHDETGNVRWLCFRITSIDWNYKKDIDIDYVWSQAYTLLSEGFKFDLNKEEIDENENANEQFIVTSTEFEMLIGAISPGTKENHTHFKTTTEIMAFIIEHHNFHQRPNKIQLGKALVRMGFLQSQRYNGKYPVKGYYIIINSEIDSDLTY
jgi:predicted P-loop ATPase